MIEIYIDGHKFEDATEKKINLDMANISGSFSFSTDKKVAFLSGMIVEMYVDDELMIDGYIDNVVESNEDGYEMTIEGRDSVCDLIDSSLPDNSKTMKKGVNLSTMIQNIINDLELELRVDSEVFVKAFDKIESEAGESGANALEYIMSYARKRGVYLRTVGKNVVIYRIENIKQDYSFETGINIVSSKKITNLQNRFSKYVVKSQLQGRQGYGGKEFFQKGEAKDDSVRDGRYLEIVATENMSNEECKTRANEEANIRRLQSFSYSLTTPNHSQDGKVFDITKGVRVNDTALDVAGLFVLNSVEFSESVEDGEKTTLGLTFPDAYSLDASMTTKTEKRIDVNEHKPKKKKGSSKWWLK